MCRACFVVCIGNRLKKARLGFDSQDWTITEWARFIMAQPFAHLSLHFDGIMVDSVRAGNASAFIQASRKHIKDTTGFDVTICRKKATTFLELVSTCHSASLPANPDLEILTIPGNCIPCALAHITQDFIFFADYCRRTSDDNLTAQRTGLRAYSELDGQLSSPLLAGAHRDSY